MTKKVSIITVNYNDREGLQKTINSVLSQTSKDYEFVVMDGGSTDGSADGQALQAAMQKGRYSDARGSQSEVRLYCLPSERRSATN